MGRGDRGEGFDVISANQRKHRREEKEVGKKKKKRRATCFHFFSSCNIRLVNLESVFIK
jgi:hypothetical protein